jgi:D-sedoheptulose 7-phosphate isomerase
MSGSESTDFLYPMIEGAPTDDAENLLADLATSAAVKADTSATLTAATLTHIGADIDAAAAAMAERFAAGGRLFTCGNGGSATDADGVAALFAVPAEAGARALPARSLVADVSIVTALSNDIGFDAIFSRQLMAHGREGDVVMGFSTSGNSANVIAAFEQAARAGMLNVGFAGNDGGAMAACDALVHLLVVRADSVHRIQEAQSAAAHALWRRIQHRLAAADRVNARPERSDPPKGAP